MIIGLGADHAGYHLKNIVRSYLQQQGITVRDLAPTPTPHAITPTSR